MGYYIRFISEDEKKISLSEIESALKSLDASYQIDRDDIDDVEGVLIYSDGVFGQIEINEKGDDIFEDEIEMLKEQVENAEGKGKEKVLNTLTQAKTLLFVRVLNQGRGWDETIEKIGPLLDWLDANRNGLVQADHQGYFKALELILEV